jgi:hypothetical protein
MQNGLIYSKPVAGTGACSIALGLFLFLSQRGVISAIPAAVALFIWLFFLITLFLALAGTLKALVEYFSIGTSFKAVLGRLAKRKEVRDYTPYMNDDERRKIGYLSHQNQQSFSCASDGGYASTLIGRCTVVPALVKGLEYSSNDMPVTILSHVWAESARHKTQVPYTPPPGGHVGSHPWRVPWGMQ